MYEDDELIEVVKIGVERRRSRKPRTCGGCGEAITVGMLYERWALRVDGEMCTDPTHLGCR